MGLPYWRAPSPTADKKVADTAAAIAPPRSPIRRRRSSTRRSRFAHPVSHGRVAVEPFLSEPDDSEDHILVISHAHGMPGVPAASVWARVPSSPAPEPTTQTRNAGASSTSALSEPQPRMMELYDFSSPPPATDVPMEYRVPMQLVPQPDLPITTYPINHVDQPQEAHEPSADADEVPGASHSPRASVRPDRPRMPPLDTTMRAVIRTSAARRRADHASANRRRGERSAALIERGHRPVTPALDNPHVTAIDGLGDRQRSPTPPDDYWETMLTTVAPDPVAPTPGSSFASSAASASFNSSLSSRSANSRSLPNSAWSSHTNLTVPSRRPTRLVGDMHACESDQSASDTEPEEVMPRDTSRLASSGTGGSMRDLSARLNFGQAPTQGELELLRDFIEAGYIPPEAS